MDIGLDLKGKVGGFLVVEQPDEEVERLSAQLHAIYQAEAHRRGDVRHADNYDDLPEHTKEWDRVLARWILTNWIPKHDHDDINGR